MVRDQNNIISNLISIYCTATILYYIAWIMFPGSEIAEQGRIADLYMLILGVVVAYIINYICLRKERTVKFLITINSVIYVFYLTLMFVASTGNSAGIKLYLMIALGMLIFVAYWLNFQRIERSTVVGRFEAVTLLMLFIMLILHLKGSMPRNLTPLYLTELSSFIEVIRFNLTDATFLASRKTSIRAKNIVPVLIAIIILIIAVMIIVKPLSSNMIEIMFFVWDLIRHFIVSSVNVIARFITFLAGYGSTSGGSGGIIPGLEYTKGQAHIKALTVVVLFIGIILLVSIFVLIKNTYKNVKVRSKDTRCRNLSALTKSKKPIAAGIQKRRGVKISHKMKRFVNSYKRATNPDILYLRLRRLCRKTSYCSLPGQSPHRFMAKLKTLEGIGDSTILQLAILGRQVDQYYFSSNPKAVAYDIKIGEKVVKDVKKTLKRAGRKRVDILEFIKTKRKMERLM